MQQISLKFSNFTKFPKIQNKNMCGLFILLQGSMKIFNIFEAVYLPQLFFFQNSRGLFVKPPSCLLPQAGTQLRGLPSVARFCVQMNAAAQPSARGDKTPGRRAVLHFSPLILVSASSLLPQLRPNPSFTIAANRRRLTPSQTDSTSPRGPPRAPLPPRRVARDGTRGAARIELVFLTTGRRVELVPFA